MSWKKLPYLIKDHAGYKIPKIFGLFYDHENYPHLRIPKAELGISCAFPNKAIRDLGMSVYSHLQENRDKMASKYIIDIVEKLHSTHVYTYEKIDHVIELFSNEKKKEGFKPFNLNSIKKEIDAIIDDIVSKETKNKCYKKDEVNGYVKRIYHTIIDTSTELFSYEEYHSTNQYTNVSKELAEELKNNSILEKESAPAEGHVTRGGRRRRTASKRRSGKTRRNKRKTSKKSRKARKGKKTSKRKTRTRK